MVSRPADIKFVLKSYLVGAAAKLGVNTKFPALSLFIAAQKLCAGLFCKRLVFPAEKS